METNVVTKGVDLVRAKSHAVGDANPSKTPDDLKQLTQRFRNALTKSVAGIIEAGQVLIEAENKLPHGQFSDWVDRELRFGAPTKAHSREANIRHGQMLRLLAKNEVISNPCHWHALPPSIRTLYELTQIRPEQRLIKLIEKGRVHAGTTREEAIGFQLKSKRVAKPELKFKTRNCHSGGRLHPLGPIRLRAGAYSQPKAAKGEFNGSNV